MEIKDFLDPTNVLLDVRATEKLQLLTELSHKAASVLGLDADIVAEEILKREALGSTGIGNGVAIPHARMEGLDRPYAVFARLKKPIGFDAIDEKPVDLVFFLLLPAADAEQLNTLACVARKLRDQDSLHEIRAADDGSSLFRAVAM